VIAARISEYGVKNGLTLFNRGGHLEQGNNDIEQIKAIIESMNQRYQTRDGSVTFAGVEGGTVKIAPAGYCWR
jgi:NifB/MoaA-like Fe-S oxidoreductase